MSKNFNQIEKAIEAAEYGEALTEVLAKYPSFGDFSKQLELPQKKNEQYFLLKLFNRMQWLLEALSLADILERNGSLNKKELFELAIIKNLIGQPCKARSLFNQSATRYGKNPLLLSEIAFTYEQEGNRDKAERILSQLTHYYFRRGELDDTGVRVFYRLINLRSFDIKESTFVEKILKKNKYPFQRVQLAHILAIAHRQNNDVEHEIDLLLYANELAKHDDVAVGSIWTQAQADEKIRLIKRVFPEPCPVWLKTLTPDTSKLIFILGMPRSGTTLVEQIIGAHSRVGNCGESLALEVMLKKGILTLGGMEELGESRFLRNLPHLSSTTLAQIRQGYLSYQRLFSDAEVITDKQLALVDFVGVMKAFFPNAKFIYVERHPLDNCVSLMQRNFKGAPYSNDPLQIIKEGLSYKERMEYWMELYPEAIYRVGYEELVSDPVNQFKALIEACNLDWQPNIIDFHMRDNSVRTPSVGQVRSKISTMAVEKWKKYERLIPLAVSYLENNTD